MTPRSVRGTEPRSSPCPRPGARLDDLNVFPVPDGDTGTNLLLTAQAAVAALDEATGDAGNAESAWLILARGAVLGARGNSGTILAQLLRGLADQLAGQPPGRRARLRRRAAEGRRHRLQRRRRPGGGHLPHRRPRRRPRPPSPRSTPGDADLAAVVRAAADGARAALEATPDQLAALREAGVVDAGGAGLCLVLDALVTTVTGVEPARAPLARRAPPAATATSRRATSRTSRRPAPAARSSTSSPTPTRPPSPGCTSAWPPLGDSLVVVGVDTPTGREWNVHVHVADVGAAIEAGIEAGRPHRISVTPLAPVRPAGAGARAARGRRGRGQRRAGRAVRGGGRTGGHAAVPTASPRTTSSPRSSPRRRRRRRRPPQRRVAGRRRRAAPPPGPATSARDVGGRPHALARCRGSPPSPSPTRRGASATT